MSGDKATTYYDLASKAAALEEKLVKLREADVPVLLDVDYDALFEKAHQELTAEREPSPVPRPLLRARLLESLKNERESLRRLLADHDNRLRAAVREIAEWEERIDAVTKDSASSSAPSDRRAVGELVGTRLKQIAEYLDIHYPQPPREDQTFASAGTREAAARPGSCGYLTISETLEELLVASTQPHKPQYIKLGPEHWLPHVQVLLDSNVAERDPQRSDHIRLTDWGQPDASN